VGPRDELGQTGGAARQQEEGDVVRCGRVGVGGGRRLGRADRRVEQTAEVDGAVALAVLAVLVAGVPVCAVDTPASNLLVTHFTVNDGLSDTVIDAIDQTSDALDKTHDRFLQYVEIASFGGD